MEGEAEYVDASFVLRALYRTSGAAPFVITGALCTSSEIVRVELALSVDRRRLLGQIDDATALALREEIPRLLEPLHLFPLSDEVLQHALEPFSSPVGLNTAIHVATAQVVAREVSKLRYWTKSDPDAAAAASRQLEVRGLGSQAQ